MIEDIEKVDKSGVFDLKNGNIRKKSKIIPIGHWNLEFLRKKKRKIQPILKESRVEIASIS